MIKVIEIDWCLDEIVNFFKFMSNEVTETEIY